MTLAIKIDQNPSNSTFFFEKLKEGPSIEFEIVKKAFESQIAPLYGSQEQALSKIQTAKDRNSEILFDGAKAVGLLVYKNELQDEFKKLGVEDSLEIKTLIVIDPKINSNKGYGSLLINRIIEVAKEKLAKNIHVTVSANAQTSLEFFKKKKFEIIEKWEDKYIKGCTECLLKLSLEKFNNSVEN
ncbi:hypothetical protein LCGC14_1933020, partial [marine sediment metagenome]